MSHVHTGELTEGRWVGKANLSFIDWTEQKCQAIISVEGYLKGMSFFLAFLVFPSYLLWVYICWFQNERGLVIILKIFFKMHLFSKNVSFCLDERKVVWVWNSVRQYYIIVPYTLLVVVGNVCATDTSACGLFLGAECLLCLHLIENGKKLINKSRRCKQASPYWQNMNRKLR